MARHRVLPAFITQPSVIDQILTHLRWLDGRMVLRDVTRWDAVRSVTTSAR